ncbi:oxidoreductase [uncultured Enterovirga sp.]|uniref:oxidoreductase n=1 Tax=uncultured Enterovirga sp. TaxID=2026352 RepID=UPI0035CB0CA4
MNPALFLPARIGPIEVKNRIAVSPMVQYSGIGGVVQPWHLQHLASMAVSGPGLILIESTAVEPNGAGSASALALTSDAQEDGLRRLIEYVRSLADVRLGIQLGHSGRKAEARTSSVPREPAGLLEEAERPVYAPSALPYGAGWAVPVALDEQGLDRIRRAFVQATRRAAQLDLNLIEVHGAHGYLLHSFLSPISNRREDDYGGSATNRIRFVAEIMAAIRDAWPADRALGIRLNSRDWQDGGITVEDTVEIARALKAAGADYVCISAGAISDEARIAPSPGYLAPDSGRVRQEAGIATLVTGMIIDPEVANDIVEKGQADMVAIGRAFLDDPRWVWHAAERLGVEFVYPKQYERSNPKTWPGRRLLCSS